MTLLSRLLVCVASQDIILIILPIRAFEWRDPSETSANLYNWSRVFNLSNVLNLPVPQK